MERGKPEWPKPTVRKESSQSFARGHIIHLMPFHYLWLELKLCSLAPISANGPLWLPCLHFSKLLFHHLIHIQHPKLRQRVRSLGTSDFSHWSRPQRFSFMFPPLLAQRTGSSILIFIVFFWLLSTSDHSPPSPPALCPRVEYHAGALLWLSS